MKTIKEDYKFVLKSKMNQYAHYCYKITKKFPREELFGIISQLRRSSLSVILNYIEGFARLEKGNQKTFLETSYGSLKESKYLLHFSLVENLLTTEEYKIALNLGEEIGAMLWTEIKNIRKFR